MDRLNNIKQEEHDGQKEVSTNNAQQQQNNQGHDASSCQLSVRALKHVKKEEEGEDGIVKQVQPCTKVKKEEEDDGECIKLEWDGDECDCEECRVDRQIKVEFNQNNNQQQANSYPGHSNAKKGVPSQISVCKRVKKEEEEEGDDQWDEDCDCDDCRRMRLKTIRLKQINTNQESRTQNRGGDDDEETEIDEDGNEDVLLKNDGNVAVDNQIGDEDADEFNQEGEDAQESSEDQMSDVDDETEIDDEEYEMEVGGEESPTEEYAPIETTLPHCNGQTRKIVRQSARHSKRKQTDYSSATKCSANPTQPNLAQPNRRFQCSHCHKSFDHNSHLQQHVRMHTGERPFHCDQCDKRFTMKCNLDSHLLTHSGERPFECRHCSKSFTVLSNRTKHEQAIHLHVKPYRCKQCGHTGTQQSHVIRHIRMVHFGLPKTIKQQRELNIIDDRDPRELVEKV